MIGTRVRQITELTQIEGVVRHVSLGRRIGHVFLVQTDSGNFFNLQSDKCTAVTEDEPIKLAVCDVVDDSDEFKLGDKVSFPLGLARHTGVVTDIEDAKLLTVKDDEGDEWTAGDYECKLVTA